MFSGGGELSAENTANCEVTSQESVGEILANYGWNSGAAGYVILSLSPDNRRVEGGRFATIGTESRDFAISASKIWQDADLNVKLTVRLLAMDTFKFRSGGLTSDILEDKEIVHFFHLCQEEGPPQPVLTPDTSQLGIGQFCLRLICHTSATSGLRIGIRLKYYVMLYPTSGDVLMEASEHARSPSWPGIKISEGEMPMLPKAQAAWGCPILPLLLPGKPFALLPHTPNGAALRTAIAAIMEKSGVPDTLKDGTAVVAKWAKLSKTAGDYFTKRGPVSWPKESDQTPTGRIIYYSSLS